MAKRQNYCKYTEFVEDWDELQKLKKGLEYFKIEQEVVLKFGKRVYPPEVEGKIFESNLHGSSHSFYHFGTKYSDEKIQKLSPEAWDELQKLKKGLKKKFDRELSQKTEEIQLRAIPVAFKMLIEQLEKLGSCFTYPAHGQFMGLVEEVENLGVIDAGNIDDIFREEKQLPEGWKVVLDAFSELKNPPDGLEEAYEKIPAYKGYLSTQEEKDWVEKNKIPVLMVEDAYNREEGFPALQKFVDNVDRLRVRNINKKFCRSGRSNCYDYFEEISGVEGREFFQGQDPNYVLDWILSRLKSHPAKKQKKQEKNGLTSSPFDVLAKLKK